MAIGRTNNAFSQFDHCQGPISRCTYYKWQGLAILMLLAAMEEITLNFFSWISQLCEPGHGILSQLCEPGHGRLSQLCEPGNGILSQLCEPGHGIPSQLCEPGAMPDPARYCHDLCVLSQPWQLFNFNMLNAGSRGGRTNFEGTPRRQTFACTLTAMLHDSDFFIIKTPHAVESEVRQIFPLAWTLFSPHSRCTCRRGTAVRDRLSASS